MTEPIINDLALRALSFALDGLSLRQKAITNNIANVDTPGYKAQRVNFEAQLQQTLKIDREATLTLQTTDNAHLNGRPGESGSIVEIDRQQNTLRNDGNNVDMDIEMSALAETSMRFQALSQLAGMKLSLLKSIVRGGR